MLNMPAHLLRNAGKVKPSTKLTPEKTATCSLKIIQTYSVWPCKCNQVDL